MQKYSAEQIMLGSYITYKRMSELSQISMGQNPSCKNSNMLNVYIDMNSIIKGLYRDNVVVGNNYLVITSSILNLCAHIREFYKSRVGVMTRIFIVYSKNYPELALQFCKDFNKFNYNDSTIKFINTVINPNIDIISLLAKYLPDIYFVYNDSVDTSVLIASLISKFSNLPSLIYSRDSMNIQTCSLFDNVIMFRPKKLVTEGDVSFYADYSNAINVYKYATGRVKSIEDGINNRLLSLIMSISGVADRGIKTGRSITQSINLVKKGIRENILVNDYNPYDTVREFCSIYNIQESAQLFKAIDVVFQNTLYSSVFDNILSMCLVNLNDPVELQHINNTYFADSPLDLNRF